MQSSSMRNIGAKNFGYNIELMRWSNRMDLIAFSNSKGEVIVQRLNWQNLWAHPPPSEQAKVRGLDWRPDERILSVAYSTGRIVLIDVENQQEIHSMQMCCDITCLGWTQNTKEFHDENEDIQDNRMFRAPHEIYLPPLPSFHALSSTSHKIDYNSTKSYCTKVFNILIVGLETGFVHFYVFGVLFCGRIDVAKALNATASETEICDAQMSSDFRTIFIFVRHNNRLKKIVFENEIFAKYTISLLNIATKHGHILNTMTYIDDIIQCITEAWETALLEMDNKLTKYANTRPPGVVSAEFLELLIFGYASERLEQFLTRDLTEKGLKKLGSAIDISYSTISQLVIKPLHTGILNICFHLNCIKGMSKNYYQYKPLLGDISNDAIMNAGAFLIKSLELQQAIEQSTRDYKIFWGWLYGAIVRLMEESVPDEVAAVSQQDITYLAEFLNTFDQTGEVDEKDATKRKFNLERVGQYLQNQNLSNQMRYNVMSEWTKLLEQNECLKSSEAIYPHHKELSLVQDHELLTKSINELFSRPEQMISEQFKFKSCIDLADVRDGAELQLHHISASERSSNLFIATVANELLYFIEQSPCSEFIKIAKFHFAERPFIDSRFQEFSSMKFRHVQFYNDNTISMLIDGVLVEENEETKLFVQFPIQQIQSRLLGVKLSESIDLTQSATVNNLYEILDPQLLRSLEVNDGHLISVSGSRKVASILSESRRRIRHYEMEVEDDDDEAETSNVNNSLDVSKE